MVGEHMQRTSRRKFALLVAVLVATALAVQMFRGSERAAAKTPAAPAVVPVKVVSARRGDLDLTLKVIGRAEAFSTVNVQARVSGQLLSLLFTPGLMSRKVTRSSGSTPACCRPNSIRPWATSPRTRHSWPTPRPC
jgi:hypothetical protein